MSFVLITFASCGSSSSSSTKPTTTGIAKRVLLSNQQPSTFVADGSVTIMDAAKDTFSAKAFASNGASKMVTAGGVTAVLNHNFPNFTLINNAAETVITTFPLFDVPEDIAITPNGQKAYAAIRNAGQVQIVRTADGGALGNLPVPSVRRLVMSPGGNTLLAFSDTPNAGNFFVIDTNAQTVRQVTGGVNLDQPFTAVFNGSDTSAFILNCGAECGGTAASVVPVDFSTATPVFGAKIPVSGATVGVMSGSTLFVAGTPPGASTGTLQAVNTAASTAGAPVAITNGLHQKMALVSNGRLYIGANACTVATDPINGQIRGCLTIFNTGNGAVFFPEFSPFQTNFDVTGILGISARNVAYVCEGDELVIFNTLTDVPLTLSTPIDIVGKARDVVQIDP